MAAPAPAVERRLHRGTGRSVDELSAQLDELDRLKRAGLLTKEEFTHRRTRLLGT